MADFLRKIPFTEQLLSTVKDFDCGNEEWEKPLNTWIKAEPNVKNGALYELRKRKGKLQVWLHVNEGNELVGYSSLGESNWHWPLPEDPRVPISVIPNVAIEKRFHRKPDECPRYSKQIMDHLVFEARQFQNRYPLLGLYVDPRNAGAIKVYLREGFQDFQEYTDSDGITYRGMLLKLDDYRPYEVAKTA
jgi:hypothetical protein